MALVMSLVVPGLGQFYNSDNKKGAIMLGVAVVLGIASAGVLWFLTAIWSAYDAHGVAKGTGKRW
jgi:TM2 domain-containing membrane protein YozV